MKKLSVLISLVIGLLCQGQAQYYINAEVGPHFVYGNTGVVEQFTIDATVVPPNTTTVKFWITDVNHLTEYASGMASYNSTYQLFYWQIDMGSLPATAIGNIVAYGAFYNGATALGPTTYPDYDITLHNQPEWITSSNGQVTNTTVDYTNNLIQMDGQLPLGGLLTLNKSVSGFAGLDTKAFNLTNQNLSFHITYDMATGLASGSQVSIAGNMNALGSTTNSIVGNNFTGGALTFDNAFNLTFNGTAIIPLPSITKSYDFQNVLLTGANVGIASIGTFCVNTSLGFSLSPKIKAQIFAGYDAGTQHWGFKQAGLDVTQFLGKVTASASAKGELKAVCGSIFGINMGWGTLARGQITADLNIGGGIQYHNISSASTNTLWYGDVNISASGEVLGYSTKLGNYHPAAWGSSNAFNFKTENNNSEFFESATSDIRSATIPAAWPMAKIATRDSVAATAWIDDVTFGNNNSALLVSYYSPITNTFSTPIKVTQNDSGIANPSITLLPNKNIFITWSQLNKSQTQLTGLSLDDVNKSQDIYFAVIDLGCNCVAWKATLNAAANTVADGEPRVYWGSGNQGMIVWQAGDNTNTGSNVYAASITQSGNTYSIQQVPYNLTPSQPGGYNYNVSVSYGNNNNAIATWLNDPDMNAVTQNTKVYYSSWNGISWWLNPLQRFDGNSPLETNGAPWIVKDYSLSTINNYGVEALNYEYFDATEKTVNGVLLRAWNDGDLISLSHPYFTYEDGTQEFKLPKVSASANGVGSLVIQQRNILDPNSEGKLNLYLKDLANNVAPWQEQTNSQYLQFVTDTNQFVWDMSSKFGYLNNSSDIIYLFNQEMDNAGNTSNTSYGERFGNPDLHLILRAFQVNNNGGTFSLSDVSDPNIDNVTGFYQELKPYNEAFELKPCYPNPFSDETNIPFHLYQGANVKIELFNLSGQSMGEIHNTALSAGDYVTQFKRRNLESGIYFYRITIGSQTQTAKMVITD